MRRRGVCGGFVAIAALAVAPATRLAAQATAPSIQHAAVPRPDEGPPVMLTALIQQALAKNPDLVALRQRIEVARQRPNQERALNPPTAEATIWQWPINTLNPANTNMYMFMLEQDLPGRGKRALRAAVAEKDVALAESDVAVRERQVIDEVKQAYAWLFIARKAIAIHLASVDLLRQIADVSQAKYATGRTSQQDVLRAVVEISKLHNDIFLFDEQANVATARLNSLLDRAPEAPVGALAEPAEQTLLWAPADLQRLAIDRQPELQRERIDIERAEAALASVKRDYQPDFTLQGGYLVMPNRSDALLARVAVTWPRAPWSRGKIDARVAEHAAALAAAKAREHAMENRVRLAVQEAYARAKSAQDRAALLRTTIVPQSLQTLDVSRVAYQTGRVDVQALIDNERTLLDSHLDYFRALSEFDQAMADLERAIGADLPANTTAIAVSQNEAKR